VKVLRHGPGLGWVVDAAVEVCGKHNRELVVDGRGPGASLIPKLESAGVRVRPIDSAFLCDAAELMLDATESGELEHFGDPELVGAVAIAAWRSVGERKAFGRRQSVGDISPLEAVSLAAKAAQENRYDPMSNIL
jgi:hypothetical protein